MAERIGEPEADDEARVAIRGHRDTDVAACGLEAFRDHTRRVHERAVPIEDDEVVAQDGMLPMCAAANPFRSRGRGEAKSIAATECGCVKPILSHGLNM